MTVGATVPLQMRVDIFFVPPRAEYRVASLVFTGEEVRVLAFYGFELLLFYTECRWSIRN